MTKTLIKIIVAVIVVVGIFFVFTTTSKRFNDKPYQQAIDSLAKQIDSLHQKNDSLETTITVVEKENEVLEVKATGLSTKIQNLKADNSKLKAAAAYHPHQVDSFFVGRYPGQYKVPTKDTTHLPIPVAKAVVVDLLDLDRTKNIVLNQDSLIQNLQATTSNKDKIIFTLRSKEENYQAIIQKQVQQQDNYKIIVDGLKADIKKSDWQIKKGKITTFALGTLALGLLVTHK